ncbi:MAG TPA: hypothetical protein ENN87_14065 [Phycisphaerales bacterium]|nr:hypothetical protein [Phycisphaerales bacterium]
MLSDRPGLGRAETFSLKKGVTLRGGYAGLAGPNSNARDVARFETILSGDLEANDRGDWYDESRNDNCYHVVTAAGAQGMQFGAILDGFTVAGGHAYEHDGDVMHRQYGGGLLSSYAHELGIHNCTFRDNFA